MEPNFLWRLERVQRRIIRVENRQYLLNNERQQADLGIPLTYICIVPRRLRTLLQAGCLLTALILLVSFIFVCRILKEPSVDCVKMMLEFSPNKGVFQIFVPTNDRTFVEQFKIKKKSADSIYMVEIDNFALNDNDDNLVDYLSYQKLTIDGFGKDSFYSNHFLSALEFSFVPPLLELTNNVRTEENITVRTILISRNSPICFNNLINEYDTIMKTNVKEMAAQLAKNKLNIASKSSKGFIRDLRTGRVSEIAEWPSFQYRFFFSITFFYIFVSAICAFFNYIQFEFNSIRLFYNHLMDRGIARPVLLISKVLTMLMAMIGIDNIVMRFIQNRFIMLIVLWSIFEAENVNSRSFRSPTSRKYWYKFYFLYLWFFLASELHYTQFTNISFSIYIFLNLYTYLFFFNHYEIPYFFASNSTFILQYRLFKQTHQVHYLPIYCVPSRLHRSRSVHRNLQEQLRHMYYEQSLRSTIWNWRIVKFMLQAAIIGCEYLDSLLPDDFLQTQPEDMETRYLGRIELNHVDFYHYVRLIVRYALFGPERPFSERQPPNVVQTERIFFDENDNNDNENENDNDNDYDDAEDRSVGDNGADNRISRDSGRSETPSTRTDDDDDVGSAFDEVNLDVDDL